MNRYASVLSALSLLACASHVAPAAEPSAPAADSAVAREANPGPNGAAGDAGARPAEERGAEGAPTPIANSTARREASPGLLPAGPNKSCPAGYGYVQDVHFAGCERRDPAAEKRWAEAKRAADARFNQADALQIFNRAPTSACHETNERSGASFVTLTIDADGRVTDVELDERTNFGPRTSACLDRTFRALRFHPFQTDPPARFARTFFVNPPGKAP